MDKHENHQIWDCFVLINFYHRLFKLQNKSFQCIRIGQDLEKSWSQNEQYYWSLLEAISVVRTNLFSSGQNKKWSSPSSPSFYSALSFASLMHGAMVTVRGEAVPKGQMGYPIILLWLFSDDWIWTGEEIERWLGVFVSYSPFPSVVIGSFTKGTKASMITSL